ncbi:MAG TPA: DUF2252 family protein [Vicinamibacterales bacterium]|nr:DUF2252 family protein [Vicinamibacterales bacterium]
MRTKLLAPVCLLLGVLPIGTGDISRQTGATQLAGGATQAVGRAQATTGSDPAAWLPARDALKQLPTELLSMLEENPYSYFRYVNRPWGRQVCDAFRADLPSLPRVRVHGDAHVEQYAFTADEFGLDDFDDSAEGPSVIDLTRFVGSLELAARRLGWTRDVDRVIDDFFRGYERALGTTTAYRPSTPAIVVRRRPLAAREPAAFLAWTDSLMQPVTDDVAESTRKSLAGVARLLARERPGTTVEQFALKKVGLIRLGIGSLLTPKLLARVEGATKDPDDDLVLEAKALSDLAAIDCLIVPPVEETLRVIDGSRQIGRLKHDVLSIVPNVLVKDREVRDWWIRTWDRTYGEVDVDHFESAEELREVAHDAGAQLGSTNLPATADGAGLRARERQAIARLQPRIRALARELSRDIVGAWERLRR